MSNSPDIASMIKISDFIGAWHSSLFADIDLMPWAVTEKAPSIIESVISRVGDRYDIDGNIARHDTAIVEAGAVLKGPIILGPNSFVAANAYLRGGVFLDEDCIVGPSCELKTTLMFKGSKVAHLSFVGDSLLGVGANIEAGATIANYRNEMDDKEIKIVWRGTTIKTGATKFGALVGDQARIGANSVIAPGAFLKPGYRLTRSGKIDQHPEPVV